jgi:hypothetical protein
MPCKAIPHAGWRVEQRQGLRSRKAHRINSFVEHDVLGQMARTHGNVMQVPRLGCVSSHRSMSHSRSESDLRTGERRGERFAHIVRHGNARVTI